MMTMRTRTVAAPFVAMALAAALSGCVSFGPKVPDTLLSMRPETAPAAGAAATGSLATALVVLEPAAEARLGVLRVPVQIDAANLAYLKKTMWVERPSRLFQRLLAETLRARGKGLVVETDTGGGGTTLSGRLLDLGYDVRTSSVVMRYEAARSVAGGGLETRRFESIVPGVEAEAEEVGPALNRVANEVARQVADWAV